MSQKDLIAVIPAKGKQQKSVKQNKKRPPPLLPRPQKEKYPTALATLNRDSAGLCYQGRIHYRGDARVAFAPPPPPQARQCISGSMSEFMSEFMSKFMSKFTTQPSAPNLPIPVPSGRFKHIHVDLVGPLMASDEGYTHVMTMVNRTTRWMEVIPLS